MARYTFLKEHHVTKMYPLRPEPWTEIDVKNIIFITRPNQLLMDYIAANIHAEEKKKKGSSSSSEALVPVSMIHIDY